MRKRCGRAVVGVAGGGGGPAKACFWAWKVRAPAAEIKGRGVRGVYKSCWRRVYSIVAPSVGAGRLIGASKDRTRASPPEGS